MKKVLKLLSVAAVIGLVVIQFFSPSPNTSAGVPTHSIAVSFSYPDSIDAILRPACYDCHSNATVYPWYAHVQPLGWWLASHVKDGKRSLNFDEFAAYRPGRQYRKFKELIELVEKDEMPLKSYRLMHPEARLTEEQQRLITDWSAAMRDTLKARFPIDSLERRQRNP